MTITFTKDQQRALPCWARLQVRAEVDESAIPSGYSLVIDVAPPFGATARAVSYAGELDLGEVSVHFVEAAQAQTQ